MADTIDLNFVTTDVSGGTWLQWATPFTDVTDLVDKAIAAAGKKCIKRLVIAGHGADHTNGFFVFDPDTAGIEVIDGGTKTPMYGPVHDQLARLKPYLCPDAVIEFRVCRFGTGDNGDRALQSVADAVGVTVTAPTNSISSLGLIGGLATDWKKIQPGQGITTSFWRGETTPPPNLGASDIAAVNAGSVTTLNPAPPLPPVLPPIPPVAYVPLPNVPPPSLANLNAPVPSLTQADQQALSNFWLAETPRRRPGLAGELGVVSDECYYWIGGGIVAGSAEMFGWGYSPFEWFFSSAAGVGYDMLQSGIQWLSLAQHLAR